MRFPDRLRIAGHSMSNNKSRTALTITIVFVISALISSLLNIAISFSDNMNSKFEAYMKNAMDYTSINFSYNASSLSEYAIKKENAKQTREDLVKLFKTQEESIGYVTYSVTESGNSYYSSEELQYVDWNFPSVPYITISEGNFPNETWANTNKVLISKEFLSSISTTSGKSYKIGDEFTYTRSYYTSDSSKGNSKVDFQFKIGGVFSYQKPSSSSETFSYNGTITSKTQLIADISNVFDAQNYDFAINNFGVYYKIPKTNFNSSNFRNSINTMFNELQKKFPKYKQPQSNYESNPISCSLITTIQLLQIISALIIGLISFVSVILILLSVGSLTNSILISVNNNRKFFGLLRALGLKERDMISTVRLESIINVIIGCILGFVFSIAMMIPFKNLVVLLGKNTVDSMIIYNDYVYTYNIYAYIPAAVALFFILFAILFSMGSLRKIARKDPIEVINEVS